MSHTIDYPLKMCFLLKFLIILKITSQQYALCGMNHDRVLLTKAIDAIGIIVEARLAAGIHALFSETNTKTDNTI